MKRIFLFAMLVAAMTFVAAAPLCAQATLLLEEPYSYDGAFAGTGHTAVYLSRVCAASPLSLRRCAPGERGVVLSRYHGVASHDWVAVPLVPYLYAVDQPDDVPLFADTKLVAFLRGQYLPSLMAALPEGDAASTPNAPWYELAGSAYDRTLYAFQVETTEEQDDAFIRKFNAAENQPAYKLISKNCADFVREVINFYWPKSIHRSVISDLGVMTPKQAAKSLVRYSKRHPEMHLSAFIIPQVPGTKRSRPVRGVLDSVLLAKKYMAPLALLHPVLIGTVTAAYWSGRFRQPRDPMVLDSGQNISPPIDEGQRRSYEELLSGLEQTSLEEGPTPKWQHLQEDAQPALDANGQAVLRIEHEGRTVEIGLCRENVLRTGAPPELVRQLLLTRLQHDLKRGTPFRASENEIASDWALLQHSFSGTPSQLARELPPDSAATKP